MLAIAACVLGASACGSPDGPTSPAPPSTGSVVFGVTSELRAGVDIAKLRVVRTIDGKVASDDTIAANDPSAPLKFPLEVEFDDLADGTDVAIELSALLPGPATSAPLLTRTAETKVVRGAKRLDRVTLQAICVPPVTGSLPDGDAGTEAGAPEAAPGGGPPCASDATCIDGTCKSPYVDPQFLPAYSSDWNADQPDPPCKPVIGAKPEVVVGEGQADYLPLTDLQTVQVEAGPQGGHHVWIAVRMRNLHRSGSRTVITATSPTTGQTVMPYDALFTYDPDEGGWCKLYGLRYQLDLGGVDYTQMLGKELDLTVTVTDTSGDQGVGTKNVTLSTDVL